MVVLYEFEPFEFQIGHFCFRIDDRPVDVESGYKRGRDVTFFLRFDRRDYRVVGAGDESKTGVTVIRYYFADTDHLNVEKNKFKTLFMQIIGVIGQKKSSKSGPVCNKFAFLIYLRKLFMHINFFIFSREKKLILC